MFVDSVCNSYFLEQSRGVKYGVEDFQMVRWTYMPVSVIVGTGLSAYWMHHNIPTNSFGLIGIMYLIFFIQSFFLSDELETNARASIKD